MREEIYKLAIVNVPKETNASMKSNITTQTTAMDDSGSVNITKQEATGIITQLNEKEIYALHFRTSKYATFAEKMEAYTKKSEGARNWVEPFVHRIVASLNESELFDTYEIHGVGMEQQLIQFTAVLDQTNWYNNTFYKEMYQSLTRRKPASDKIDILAITSDRLLTDDEINTGNVSATNNIGLLSYNIPYWCARDFLATKEDIAKQARSGEITREQENLLNTDFPPVVFKGNYPVKASYTLPGKKAVTTSVNVMMYNPVTP